MDNPSFLIESPQDREKRELDYARCLASRYGYVLLKRDQIQKFGATQSLRPEEYWHMKDRGYLEDLRKRLITAMGRAIGQEIVNSGYINIEDLHGGWRADVSIIKQREPEIGYPG